MLHKKYRHSIVNGYGYPVGYPTPPTSRSPTHSTISPQIHLFIVIVVFVVVVVVLIVGKCRRRRRCRFYVRIITFSSPRTRMTNAAEVVHPCPQHIFIPNVPTPSQFAIVQVVDHSAPHPRTPPCTHSAHTLTATPSSSSKTRGSLLCTSTSDQPLAAAAATAGPGRNFCFYDSKRILALTTASTIVLFLLSFWSRSNPWPALSAINGAASAPTIPPTPTPTPPPLLTTTGDGTDSIDDGGQPTLSPWPLFAFINFKLSLIFLPSSEDAAAAAAAVDWR